MDKQFGMRNNNYDSSFRYIPEEVITMERLYLVTGAAGHLGSAVVRKLTERGKSVRVLVLPGEKHIPKNTEVFYGDVRNVHSLVPCFENQNHREFIVIHCAGIVTISSKYQQNVYDVNVVGTKNIVDLCKTYHVSKLVYVSSVHAIPEKPHGTIITETADFDPDHVFGFYAKTKAEATSYVLDGAKQGLNACVVHPSGITGPYDYGRGHITALVIDYYKRHLTSGVNGGYDFVDVRDVANGIIAACDKGRKGECYILSNQYYTVKEILNTLHRITGKREIRHFLPLWFIRITAPLAEMYYKILRQPPLFTSYSIYTLHTNALFSHQKATEELGYTTRSLDITLSDTVEWLKSIGKI
jgi:dihydroflavonol-4-reductase